MWYQVELPQAMQIAEVQFESGIVAPENISTVPGAPVRTAIAGGGRGRGGVPGAAPAAPAPPPVAPKSGYPRGYKLEVSTDGSTWKTVAQGKGSGTATRISFAPVRAKFVKVTETADGADLPPFMIQRFSLYDVSGSRGNNSQH
jgi:hypothetical protein